MVYMMNQRKKDKLGTPDNYPTKALYDAFAELFAYAYDKGYDDATNRGD